VRASSQSCVPPGCFPHNCEIGAGAPARSTERAGTPTREIGEFAGCHLRIAYREHPLGSSQPARRRATVSADGLGARGCRPARKPRATRDQCEDCVWRRCAVPLARNRSWPWQPAGEQEWPCGRTGHGFLHILGRRLGAGPGFPAHVLRPCAASPCLRRCSKLTKHTAQTLAL
jgi:hypothetical protein